MNRRQRQRDGYGDDDLDADVDEDDQDRFFRDPSLTLGQLLQQWHQEHGER
jgi:hypothetical protein